MLLYNVTYPTREMDSNVPWSYLERLARDRGNEGAKAKCVNGEPQTWALRDGRWIEDHNRTDTAED